MKVFKNDKYSFKKYLQVEIRQESAQLVSVIMCDSFQFPMIKFYCDIYSKILKGRVASF